MGCDFSAYSYCDLILDFNPRTPGGVRPFHLVFPLFNGYFIPRTPGGVRHRVTGADNGNRRFQSTHPGWGATNGAVQLFFGILISIHAPRVGCDDHHVNKIFLHGVFQSTHPGWGATKHNVDTIKVYKNFNPRTPGGVRRRLAGAGNAENKFQSTHPGWGATRTQAIISGSRWDFNPRTPGGVRLQAIAEAAGLKKFQSTHPGWGATRFFVRRFVVL